MTSDGTLLSQRKEKITVDLTLTASNCLGKNKNQEVISHQNMNNVHPYTISNGKTEGSQKEELSSEKHNEQPDSTNDIDPNATLRGFILSWRFVITILLNLSILVGMMPRFGLSVAVVCMVRPVSQQNSSLASLYPSSTEAFTPVNNSSDSDIEIDGDASKYEFDWSTETVGLVLAGPYYISFVGPLVSDFGRQKLGSRAFLSICIGMSAMLSFITPLGARLSPFVLVVIGCLQGVLTSVHVPLISDTIAWWGPVNEKLTLIAISMSGANLAGILSSVVPGFLCTIPVDYGWPFIFYMFGGASAIWALVWAVLSSRRPEDHRFVSKQEVQYILKNRKGMDETGTKKDAQIPYMKILTSRPVFGGILTLCFHHWFFTTTFSYMAIFFNQVQGFSVEETGILVALIAVVRICGMYTWTAIGSYLLSFKTLSTNKVRKLCLCSGVFFAAFMMFLIATLLFSVSKWTVITLLLLGMLGLSVGTSVLSILPQDMAPRYAGIISGFMFSVSSLYALSAPLMISALAPTNSPEEWQILWILFGVNFIVCGTVFLFIADASIQPWAVPTSSTMANHQSASLDKVTENAAISVIDVEKSVVPFKRTTVNNGMVNKAFRDFEEQIAEDGQRPKDKFVEVSLNDVTLDHDEMPLNSKRFITRL